MRCTLLSLLVTGASAFTSPQSSQRTGSVSLNAEEFSKSVPFLVRPDKLDGTLPGDMGFDPMRLSDIQTDLRYAQWAEVKHGRICMLAVVGMVVQQSGIHVPGAQFTNTDVFGAPGTVGFAGNLQIFLTIAAFEFANFSKHYDDETAPGDYGYDYGLLKMMDDKELKYRMESEIVHGRLAMIAFVGAVAQTLIFEKPLLSL